MKFVTGAKAAGASVLVEMLTAEEAMSTRLILGNNTKTPPQGYILGIGPSLEADKWGIKVGDRVLLQGSFVPLPRFQENKRELGIVQAYDIKCVLIEAEGDAETTKE